MPFTRSQSSQPGASPTDGRCRGVGDGRDRGVVRDCVPVADEANQPATQKERVLAAGDEDTKITSLQRQDHAQHQQPLIEAWEASGLQPMPMGLQGILIQDLVYSLRKAGRKTS